MHFRFFLLQEFFFYTFDLIKLANVHAIFYELVDNSKTVRQFESS